MPNNSNFFLTSFFSFYFIFLTFFSFFFYSDPEFFLAFSAFLIFFVTLAIINSFFDVLIHDKFAIYKNQLNVAASHLNDLDSYGTSLLVYLEDLCDFIFYITTHDYQINENYELEDAKILMDLDKIFFEFLKKHLELENSEYLLYQLDALEYTGNVFVEFYTDELKPKKFEGQIDVAFFEPRSLKQLYVARPVKPGDYIPDWQPDL